MPKPKDGESQKDFVSRCIPIVMGDGTAKDNKQAVAVCYSMYAEAKKEAGEFVDDAGDAQEKSMGEMEEVKPMSPAMYDVTSLKAMVEAKMALEAAEDMNELSTMFKQVVDNIMWSDIEEKGAAIIKAAGEFAEMGRTVNERIGRKNPFEKEAGWRKEQLATDNVKAQWTTAYVNNLPDSSFLYIKPGGEKDGDGKTTPSQSALFSV